LLLPWSLCSGTLSLSLSVDFALLSPARVSQQTVIMEMMHRVMNKMISWMRD
jgi:hypothetical protein